MEFETLTVECDANVATVTLNRPPVNAVSAQMQIDLIDAFSQLSEDRQVHAVVLAGAGDRAFCGGIDLKELESGVSGGGDSLRSTTNPGWRWREAQHVIRHSAVPVIAAVERPAIGAGFGLIGVSDLIVASTTASFGLTEINVGLLGGASKALRLVGPHKARMMMYTGELQSAAEFYRLGVIERLVEPGGALAAATEIARRIAGKSPLAMRLAKESILRIETDELEEQYRTEWDYTNRLRGFNDSAEGLAAFLEKREPNWTLS
ncbi:enoyl-CoA hydratase-related protein [Frigoribacterium sp. UYMn621]|uniref:enoyl-CoA hydratase-related protein n=1 Tax=Frigoribacterium sp. UYMn621 TaxID=3156343 RepID=UPI00339926BA